MMLKNALWIAAKVFWRRKMFTAINLLCIVLTLVVLLVVTAVMEHSFAPSGIDVNRDRVLEVSQFVTFGKNRVMLGGLGQKMIDTHLRNLQHAEKVSMVSNSIPAAIYQDDRVEKVSLVYTDAAYWEIYYYPLLEGRYLHSSEVEQGRFVAVINTSLAQKMFGAVSALGKKLNVRGYQYEVIGVFNDGLRGAAPSHVWVPYTTSPVSADRVMAGDYSARLLAHQPSELAALKQEVLEIGRTIQIADPHEWSKTLLLANTKLDMVARGFGSDPYSEDSGATEFLFWVGVLMFLFMLLPALNLINLNVGRMMERSAEIGVRKAFGASTFELVMQFLIENIVLCLVACAIALLATQGLLMWLNHSGVIPYLELGINFSILLYGLVITLVFGVVSGVVPAWRMACLDPVIALKGNA